VVKSASGLAAINEALVEARGVDLFREARRSRRQRREVEARAVSHRRRADVLA